MLTDQKLETEFANAAAVNRKNLEEILRDNKDTAFGKKHGFERIHTVEEFKRSVPLSYYHDYQKDIDKMYEGGENILTAYPVNCFAASSGTEGNVKYIPVTQEALARYGAWVETYKGWKYAQAGHGKRFFINFFRTDVKAEIEKELLISEIFYRHLYETGELDMETFAGGTELLFDREPGDGMYARAWLGILTGDIVTLEAIFQYDVLNFFSYLEKTWEAVIRDIKNGVVPDHIELSETIKNKLLSCERNPGRIEYVERECKKGFDGIAKRLWPGLILLGGVSNKAYFAEDTALGRYVGSVPQYCQGYCSSECFIGEPVGENSFDYILAPKTAFYEFIPYSVDDGITKTILPHECEPGKLYEIVITNFSGLYRYRMGDILQVKDLYQERPVFEFAFRRKHTLNVAGEKMSVPQMEEAVRKVQEKGIPVEAYSFGVSMEQMPARYLALFAVKEGADTAASADILDEALAEVNSDYMDLRRLGSFDKPVVYAVDSGRYSGIIENFRKERRQNKPLHILPENAEEILRREVREEPRANRFDKEDFHEEA